MKRSYQLHVKQMCEGYVKMYEGYVQIINNLVRSN